MKKVYITRNALFKDINMVLCNNVTEVDKDFIENNWNLFTDEVTDDDVDEEIESLSEIDWTREEFKPFDIAETMTKQEIKDHLTLNHFDEVRNDMEPNDLEPYQYFSCNLDDWQRANLEEYGVKVGYSEALDQHIIPMYDFGTSWSMFSYSKEVSDDYALAHNETLKRTTHY